ncbi:unnamed protein product [Orchesella dallaii]|uniref:Uncharacterized protein n=1 Tax=Orchesella dallaii TaxID=48710 RepID=A0ABP1R3U1_9HEXA
MLRGNHASVVVILFLIFITAFEILATPNCINDIETKVCVDEVGFHYLLGNGTWNISLTEGENLTERESFLSTLQNNQCPISVSSSTSTCDNECCYCNLRLPLPRHPITEGVLIPEHLTCVEQISRNLKYENWHLTRDSIQQCKTGDPVRLPFVCVLMDNIKELKLTYNNPQILNKNSYYEDVRQKRPDWSWRNTSAVATKAEAVNQTVWKTFSMVDESIVESEQNITIYNEKLSNGIEYSWYRSFDELGQEFDYVTVDDKSISNYTVNFSGKTECLSKHRRWDMYEPCTYTINTIHFTECSELKIAVNIVSRIIYNYVADMSIHTIEEESWNLNMTDEIKGRSPEGILTCANFPSHFTAVEVWVEGQHISTVLSFEAAASVMVIDELKVTASVWQHIATEKDYTNLSRFWANFYFGDCLFRRCWRDLWNVLPEDLLRNFVFIDGDNGSFRWGFLLPVLLVCFVIIVRANLINSPDCEF